MRLPSKLLNNKKIESLVENRTSYTLNNAEMFIFETMAPAEQVLLKFDRPVIASMLQGKKVMHLKDQESFTFLPGESLILPADEPMCIDFPGAKMDAPTRCMVMTVSEDKINETLALLNETMPKVEGDEWNFTGHSFHFADDKALYGIVQRLLFIFAEDHPSKDVFADLMLRELLIRILQAETRKVLTGEPGKNGTHHRIGYIIEHIRQNLDKPISIKELSDLACMSESNFHRTFRNELGISPIDFINEERIKLATHLLHNRDVKIKEVYLQCGFNSPSYFTRLFKKKKGFSPKEFQELSNNTGSGMPADLYELQADQLVWNRI